MEVVRVELVAMEGLFKSKGKRQLPHTFFSLNPGEQELYDSFRAKHQNLDGKLKELEDKGYGTKEREDGEKGVEQMFLELVASYMQKQKLEVLECWTTYGDGPRTTSLRMPRYNLFKDDQPFGICIEPKFLFSTKDKNLSCESELVYHSKSFNPYEDRIVRDLLKKITQEKRWNGIGSPLVSIKGGSIYFASTDFTTSLMQFIKDLLGKIGKEEIKKLTRLYCEYSEQCRMGELRDTSLEQEIFKEAYEKRLGRVLEIHRLMSSPVETSQRLQ